MHAQPLDSHTERRALRETLEYGRKPSPPRTSIARGDVIESRYRVQRELGCGGMGTVVLAEDLRLCRNVAVKLLRPCALAADVVAFHREARLLAAVASQHVVTLLDAGEHQGRCYFVMEYVDGQTLDELIVENGDGGLPLDVVIGFASQLCAGLGAAHERGIIHRDVKPGNVMISGGRRAVLLDFGLACDDDYRNKSAVSGTTHYLAPEDIRGRSLTGAQARRSDIYSLGVTIFEMLAGVPPFDGADAQAVMDLHLRQPPPSLVDLRPDLPSAIDEVLRRALAKNPLSRQCSCAELADDLRAVRDGNGRSHRGYGGDGHA